ncbi:MAG: ferredoxin family protein, partial [Candidatus Marinimicrobia bacterium]|nr:ferredoxin family protein [Candidatus Neomarinimicrobiota bacterium]
MAKARGLVAVNIEECKGCNLCIVACPVDVLHLANSFNTHGYSPAEYDGEGCTGCGICFYACPEPGAITVYKNW